MINYQTELFYQIKTNTYNSQLMGVTSSSEDNVGDKLLKLEIVKATPQ